jgi:hypothetical protein
MWIVLQLYYSYSPSRTLPFISMRISLSNMDERCLLSSPQHFPSVTSSVCSATPPYVCQLQHCWTGDPKVCGRTFPGVIWPRDTGMWRHGHDEIDNYHLDVDPLTCDRMKSAHASLSRMVRLAMAGDSPRLVVHGPAWNRVDLWFGMAWLAVCITHVSFIDLGIIRFAHSITANESNAVLRKPNAFGKMGISSFFE